MSTKAFNTLSSEDWTVPAGITSLSIAELTGPGGSGSDGNLGESGVGGQGGIGGEWTSVVDFPVTPGDVIRCVRTSDYTQLIKNPGTDDYNILKYSLADDVSTDFVVAGSRIGGEQGGGDETSGGGGGSAGQNGINGEAAIGQLGGVGANGHKGGDGATGSDTGEAGTEPGDGGGGGGPLNGIGGAGKLGDAVVRYSGSSSPDDWPQADWPQSDWPQADRPIASGRSMSD